jgi:hypothetical protein
MAIFPSVQFEDRSGVKNVQKCLLLFFGLESYSPPNFNGYLDAFALNRRKKYNF